MSNNCSEKLLSKKVVVVTGAGSGIGKSIIGRFVKEGALCVAADINLESVEELKNEFADYKDQIRALKVNVASKEEVEGMIDYAVKEFGKMDIIINNAGILDNLTVIDEMEDDLWQRVMQVNLDSVMYGSRKAVRYFLENKIPGVIVNTASLSGVCAGRGGTAYTTSKYAVVGLTKNIAFMYADEGIRCNAICPGNTQTNIHSNMRQPSKRGMEKATTGYKGAVRAGTSDEVADLALFLASDQSRFINGEAVVIDGGWSAY